MKRIILGAVVAVAIAAPAQAHNRYHHHYHPTKMDQPCSLFMPCAPDEDAHRGVVYMLAAKVSEIESACGSHVISAVRHTYIAGTRHVSLHASGKAVDMTGNPRCIYARLQGWAGGYSVDYGRMRHVHISYDPDGGREMGLHFRHGGGHHHHHRHYA